MQDSDSHDAIEEAMEYQPEYEVNDVVFHERHREMRILDITVSAVDGKTFYRAERYGGVAVEIEMAEYFDENSEKIGKFEP